MRLCLWLSAALLAGSAQASIIDGGSIDLESGVSVFRISSTDGNFSFNGRIGAFVDQFCFSCPVGTLNKIFFATVSDASLGFGDLLTVNGVKYLTFIFNDPGAFLPSSFVGIETDPYEVTGAGQYVVPFHITSGQIQVSLTSGGPGTPLLVNTLVSGGGEAFFQMVQGQGGNFVVGQPISFVFIPEPASGLSVAGGLFLVVYLRRRVLRKSRRL